VPYVTAVIAAAGQGTRMKAGVNKQFLLLQGKPVLVHTLELFQQCDLITEVILVATPGEEDYCRKMVQEYGLTKVTRVVSGGRERQHSVAHGLAPLSSECEIVAVHDGARPLLLPSHLTKVIQAAGAHDGAILAVPVKDTIKEISGNGQVKSTLERAKLWAVQTPQVFKKGVITFAYDRAFQEGIKGTDDASLVEQCGFQVQVVEGSYENIKITTPEDLDFAELILRRRG